MEKPLELVDQLFEQYIELGVDGNIHDFSVEDHFKTLLTRDFVSKLPFFRKESLGSISNNSLVLYRGLVYDIYDPEFYSGSYKDSSTGKLKITKYRDTIPQDVDEECYDDNDGHEHIMERLSILCSAIPGESEWIRECSNEAKTTSNSTVSNCKKRPLNDDLSAESEGLDLNPNETHTSPINKQNKASAPVQSCSDLSFSHIAALNNPVVVKLYHDLEELHLNDFVEFLCVYTADPLLDSNKTPSSSDNNSNHESTPFHAMVDGFDDDFKGILPPASIAPRLHCITYRKLGASYPFYTEVTPTTRNDFKLNQLLTNLHVNSSDEATIDVTMTPFIDDQRCFRALVHSNFEGSVNDSNNARNCDSGGLYLLNTLQDKDSLLSIRQNVLTVLSEALEGDLLSAEYLLLCLLSRLLSRESVLVGMIAVQLIGITDDLVVDLEQALKQIVPRLVKVSADPFVLNRGPCYQPSRDYHTNSMTPSPLRIANGTVLLIDNVTLMPLASTSTVTSQLSALGTKSLRTLRGIVTEQQISFNCGYSEVHVPTESPCVILTSHSRSHRLFGDEFDVISVPFKHRNVSDNDPNMRSDSPELVIGLTDEQVELVRFYLASVRLISTNMDETMQALVENDYIQSRQASVDVANATAVLNGSDFHRWIALVRLLTASFGEANITIEHWQHMKKMEAQRIGRMSSLNPAVAAVLGPNGNGAASSVATSVPFSPNSVADRRY